MILIQSELFHWLGRDDYNISAPQAVPTQSTEYRLFQTSIFNESN